jgi:hypothetical protein
MPWIYPGASKEAAIADENSTEPEEKQMRRSRRDGGVQMKVGDGRVEVDLAEGSQFGRCSDLVKCSGP